MCKTKLITRGPCLSKNTSTGINKVFQVCIFTDYFRILIQATSEMVLLTKLGIFTRLVWEKNIILILFTSTLISYS